MKLKTIHIALVAAAAALAGCSEELMDASHKKFTQPAQDQWLQAKQGIMYEVAIQQYKVGDYDKCRATLKSALETNVPTAAILTLSAKVDMEQNGSLERAVEYL